MKKRLLWSCTNPQWVWRDKVRHRDAILVPCGKCLACRFKNSYAWKERIVFESKTVGVENCCFVTLTYADECYSPDGVSVDDCQKYLKRLRYYVKSYVSQNRKIRFFLCSEYGTHTKRAHYHAVIFGLSAIEYKLMENLIKQEGREQMRKEFDPDALCYVFENRPYQFNLLWPYGWSTVAAFTESRAAYVAGYVTKDCPVPDGCNKPFRLMSRKPGLGYEYIKSNPDEVKYRPNLNDDFVTLSRYVEDKLYPPDSLERLARDAQKEKFLISFGKLMKDLSADTGKSVDQLTREMHDQINVDLAALVRMSKGVL